MGRVFLYTNIGSKIRGLAKVICWIGIIISFIAGIAMIAGMSQYNAGMGVLTGLLYMALGSLISWISSLALYGFGELIEKTAEIARNTAPH
jgi:hypothetical protein